MAAPRWNSRSTNSLKRTATERPTERSGTPGRTLPSSTAASTASSINVKRAVSPSTSRSSRCQMRQLRHNGRQRSVLTISYRPPDGTSEGWEVTARFPGDESKRYEKLWRRKHNSIDVVRFRAGFTYCGFAKVSGVALVKDPTGKVLGTDVTWHGLGSPEQNA